MWNGMNVPAIVWRCDNYNQNEKNGLQLCTVFHSEICANDGSFGQTNAMCVLLDW